MHILQINDTNRALMFQLSILKVLVITFCAHIIGELFNDLKSSCLASYSKIDGSKTYSYMSSVHSSTLVYILIE